MATVKTKLNFEADVLKKIKLVAVAYSHVDREFFPTEYALEKCLQAPFGNRPCKHEFVLTGTPFAEKYGVHTLDIAKRIQHYGLYPPTIYFPLNVPECLMIEPTETQSKESLDEFADALLAIAKEAEVNPQLVKDAPPTAPVTRLDDVKAAREPVLCYKG